MMTITHDSGNGPEPHYTVTAASELTGITRAWLHHLIQVGKVQGDHFEHGRRWVPESEINRLKKEKASV